MKEDHFKSGIDHFTVAMKIAMGAKAEVKNEYIICVRFRWDIA